MKKTLLTLGALGLAALLTPQANAAVVLTFGESIAGSTPISATVAGGVTTVSATNAEVTITSCGTCGPLVSPDFLNLTATSVGAATVSGSDITQHFTGSFSIRTGTGTGGTNILSGTFHDAVFGSGASLTLSASNTGTETLSLNSGIPAVQASLGGTEGISFGFADVTPPASTETSAGVVTLAPFVASLAGTVSASPAPAPEPTTVALLGTGLVGLAGLTTLRRRRRR